MGKVVITGGAGFVGFRLGLHIASHCQSLGSVLLFDTRKPQGVLPVGVEAVVGDIRSAEDVTAALKGATLVFHIASYGMSGYEALHEDKIKQINVIGTQNIIAACKSQGVERLVYMSSYNVVFDSATPIVAGTEATTRYVTTANCSDPYSLTKATAEQAVLAADGFTPPQTTATTTTSAADVGGAAASPRKEAAAVPPATRLRTCALRPAAIWGPGEQRHLPRIISMARQGYLTFVFGDPSCLVDFVHVDNLVAAAVLAAQALQGDARAGGKAYFINDDNPINNFDFFKHIMEGLGYSWPRRRLPYWLVYLAAVLLEFVAGVAHNVSGQVLMVPLISRMEVAKCGITHYAKCDLAREDLGYSPLRHGYEAAIDWYKVRSFGPVPEPPEVRARRLVRGIRLCMAFIMVVLILVSWHTTTERKAREEAARLVAEVAGAGGGAPAAEPGLAGHGGEL